MGLRTTPRHTGRHFTNSKTTTAITPLEQGLEAHLRLDPLVCFTVQLFSIVYNPIYTQLVLLSMIFVKAQDSVTGIYYSLVCFIMIYDFKIDFRDTSDATRHHIDIKGSNISGQKPQG